MKSSSRLTALLMSFLVLFFLVTTASAQEKKVEIIPFFGYTASGGISVQPQDIGNGVIVDRIGPKSGWSYGFQLDFLASENWSVGFNLSDQRSKLETKGSEKVEWTDMNVRNYHGIFTYNMGDEDETVRPYLFGGLGATQYAPGELGGQGINSSTRFSMTWGGGVKAYASENVGIRLGGRWTPTYIQSTAGGVWCNPFWPWSCWIVGNPHYSHQFELSAGLILRF